MDWIVKSLENGMSISPIQICKASQTDRLVDSRVADLIEKILDSRRRNAETVHLSECIMTGKPWRNVDQNYFYNSSQGMYNKYIETELNKLYSVSGIH